MKSARHAIYAYIIYPPMNHIRVYHDAAGKTGKHSIHFGGLNIKIQTSSVIQTEKFIDHVWITSGSTNYSHTETCGCGVVNSAICISSVGCEKSSDTVWYTIPSRNIPTTNGKACGLSNHAIASCGILLTQENNYAISNQNIMNTTEIWRDTVWVTGPSLSLSRYCHVSFGNPNSAICATGIIQRNMVVGPQTEKFNGSVWTLTSPCLIARAFAAGNGISASFGMLLCGRRSKTFYYTNDSEEYKYDIWMTSVPVNITRFGAASTGHKRTSVIISGDDAYPSSSYTEIGQYSNIQSISYTVGILEGVNQCQISRL